MSGHYLPYVLGSYAIAIGMPLIFSLDALLRLRKVRSRLSAADPRGRDDA